MALVRVTSLGSLTKDMSLASVVELKPAWFVMSLLRILKSAKIRPLKIHLHQGLEPGDYQRRMAFLAWLATAREDGNISSMLWTDENRFHNNGTINRHNCHYWSEDNPHWMRETNFQRIWGINVWCGMIDGYIIGPKFYGGTLTGERQRIMGEDFYLFCWQINIKIRILVIVYSSDQISLSKIKTAIRQVTWCSTPLFAFCKEFCNKALRMGSGIEVYRREW
ncbi:hypothetical protein NQ318_022847 [Aromia moschata]|uniref:Uncharacterized protein n=1 Tax=Aromia moschata TaxID=1265417 RepID=A0AAV8XWI7_9CUCU|nr:hypothetical protein NQ318_022847 [Aromia moschata]